MDSALPALSPPPLMPRDLAALVWALAANPGDEVTQNALCDWLEEAGDGQIAHARICRMRTFPDAEEVAKIIYPKGYAVCHTVGGLTTTMFHARDGTGWKFPLSRISEQLAGRVTLIDREVEAAARVVRGRAMLKLVIGENADV